MVTFDDRPAAEDWFAVTLDGSVKVRRIVFAHGMNFHDGGWFDTSRGKPRVQVRRGQDGPWETVGELADYPATTARAPGNLKAGQRSSLRLGEAVEVVAVRVVGKPAGGDNPRQSFASCAKLEAFER